MGEKPVGTTITMTDTSQNEYHHRLLTRHILIGQNKIIFWKIIIQLNFFKPKIIINFTTHKYVTAFSIVTTYLFN